MTIDPEGSVTRWIGALARGDADEAALRLWERYFGQTVRLARARLGPTRRGVADEEDAALSAFDSLCRGIAAGRFPGLDGRDDLWRLLATITARKVADQIEHERRKKRGGGQVLGQSDLAGAADDAAGLDGFVGREPSPVFVATVTEEVRRLFGLLPDETLRVVALLRMEGHTNEEIAASLGCAVRSVERKLGRIRALWDGRGQGP
jgi:DNA-directed RNA polymerase specialized sigma24 family protein